MPPGPWAESRHKTCRDHEPGARRWSRRGWQILSLTGRCGAWWTPLPLSNTDSYSSHSNSWAVARISSGLVSRSHLRKCTTKPRNVAGRMIVPVSRFVSWMVIHLPPKIRLLLGQLLHLQPLVDDRGHDGPGVRYQGVDVAADAHHAVLGFALDVDGTHPFTMCRKHQTVNVDRYPPRPIVPLARNRSAASSRWASPAPLVCPSG